MLNLYFTVVIFIRVILHFLYQALCLILFYSLLISVTLNYVTVMFWALIFVLCLHFVFTANNVYVTELAVFEGRFGSVWSFVSTKST